MAEGSVHAKKGTIKKTPGKRGGPAAGDGLFSWRSQWLTQVIGPERDLMSVASADKRGKPKGVFGKYISTKMRQELSWQSVYLLDFFQGLWRNPSSTIHCSNKFLQTRFGFSYGVVCRALNQLESFGYIKRDFKTGARIILKGDQGVIVPDQDLITGDQEVIVGDRGMITSDQGGDHQRSGGVITGDHHKTSESKNLISLIGEEPTHTQNDVEEFFEVHAETPVPPQVERKAPDLPKPIHQGRKTYLSPDRRLQFERQGKKPAADHPDLYFNEIEGDNILMFYMREDLDVDEGFLVLEHCAMNNTEKFNQYDSHYHCMVGWVAAEVRKRAWSRANLANAKRRLKNG